MNEKARDLSEKLTAFNAEVISFVEGVNAEDWTRPTVAEEWPVGVAARHIGAGHYAIQGLAEAFVNGGPLPELSFEAITEMANEHARKNAGCTREEVLSILRKNGETLAAWVGGRTDEELARKVHFPLFGKEASAHELIEAVVLVSGREHLDSLKKTLAG